MHQTASTHMLKPIARPFLPTTLTERLRGRYDTPDETRADRLLRAVAPSLVKIKRQSRAGLKAAIAILEAPTIAIHDVPAVLYALPNTPHMAYARRGCVEDGRLWDDALDAMKTALAGRATAGAEVRLGICLALVDTLLSVREHERYPYLAERELA